MNEFIVKVPYRLARKRKYLMYMAVCFISILFLISGCNKQKIELTNAEESGNTEEYFDESGEEIELIHTDRLTIALSYGFDKSAKYDRYMGIFADITNEGDTFTGKIQITLTNHVNNAMYEEDLFIEAGERTKLEIPVPIENISTGLVYRIIDDEKNIIAGNSTYILFEDNLYMGILSEAFSDLSYLNSKTFKVFDLNKKGFPTNYLSLDALDIIVINDYDTRQLDEQQLIALQNWVYNGGTLAISTGSSEDKVFEGITPELLDCNYADTMGQDERLKDSDINVGNFNLELENKKITDIRIEDSEILVSNNGIPVLQNVVRGKGNILVFGFDLGDTKNSDSGTDTVIETILVRYMTELKKHQINVENNEAFDSGMYKALELGKKEVKPKIWIYIIILLCYCFLVGPILYLVLKKREKSNKMWIVLPLLSLIFTVIMFWAGHSTRVTGPYMSYLSYYMLSDTGVAFEQTYFSLTSPYNKSYPVTFNGEFEIGAIIRDNGYKFSTMEEPFDSRSVIRRHNDITEIEVNKTGVFVPNYYRTSAIYEMDGYLDYELNNFRNNLSGTFTNHFGYTLHDVMIISDNMLVGLGDIEDGETVNLENKVPHTAPMNSDLDYNLKELLNLHNINNTSLGKARAYYSMTDFVKGITDNKLGGSYFVAFPSGTSRDNIVNNANIKTYGIDVLFVPLQSNYQKDKEEYIPNLDSYLDISEGNFYKDTRIISSDEIVVKYNFAKNDKIKTVIYCNKVNKEFSFQYDYAFSGNAYFYNHKEQKYDLIFTSGKAGEMNDLENYLDDNNSLQVKYMVNYDAVNNIVIPVLSAVKEVD